MHARVKGLFYRVLIVAIFLIALMAILVIAAGDFDQTDGRILGSVLAIVLYSWTAYTQSLLFDRRPDLSLVAIAGVGASLLGFVLALVAIWSDADGSGHGRRAGIFLVAALALADFALLLVQRRQTDGAGVRSAIGFTIGCVCLLALLLIAELWERGTQDDSYYRFVGVIAVLWALGTVLIPVLRRAEAAARR